LFEAVVFGIYGNWLISFLDKISFEEVMVWYQPLCVGVSFASLLMLFSFSIFRPNLVTRWFGFMMGFAHAIGNYGALWAEGLQHHINLNVFFWVGFALFGIIYLIELQRIRQARR